MIDMEVSRNRGTHGVPLSRPFSKDFPWNKPSSYLGSNIYGNPLDRCLHWKLVVNPIDRHVALASKKQPNCISRNKRERGSLRKEVWLAMTLWLTCPDTSDTPLPRTRYRAHRDPQNKPQSFSEWCPDTRWIKPPSCRSSLADSLHPLPSSTIDKSIACQYIVPTRSSVLDSQTVQQSIPLDIPLE